MFKQPKPQDPEKPTERVDDLNLTTGQPSPKWRPTQQPPTSNQLANLPFTKKKLPSATEKSSPDPVGSDFHASNCAFAVISFITLLVLRVQKFERSLMEEMKSCTS